MNKLRGGAPLVQICNHFKLVNPVLECLILQVLTTKLKGGNCCANRAADRLPSLLIVLLLLLTPLLGVVVEGVTVTVCLSPDPSDCGDTVGFPSHEDGVTFVFSAS